MLACVASEKKNIFVFFFLCSITCDIENLDLKLFFLCLLLST